MTGLLFNTPRPARAPALPRHERSGTARAASAHPLLRWLAPAALAAALGATALAMPSQARADDTLARVLVDVADVIFRSGAPYYRGDQGYERLVVVRGPYGPQYYRHVQRGHYRGGYGDRQVKCNKHGKCKVKYTYYDPRHDRDRGHYRVVYRDRDRDRDWHRDRDWDHDRDWDRDRDHDRVRYRLIRAHGGD